jgi:hypothetical protein
MSVVAMPPYPSTIPASAFSPTANDDNVWMATPRPLRAGRAPRSASRTPSGLGGDVQSCMRRQQLEMRRETRDQRRGQQFVSFTIHGRHRWRRPRRPLPRTRGWCLASEDSPSANSKSRSFCSLMSFASAGFGGVRPTLATFPAARTPQRGAPSSTGSPRAMRESWDLWDRKTSACRYPSSAAIQSHSYALLTSASARCAIASDASSCNVFVA